MLCHYHECSIIGKIISYVIYAYFAKNAESINKEEFVPENGKEGGWDVIYKNADGVTLLAGDVVHKVYVEMKNKHNTMNSASAGKIYIKMQNQLLKDDDCVCFLVEAIAQRSQNIKWEKLLIKTKYHIEE